MTLRCCALSVPGGLFFPALYSVPQIEVSASSLPMAPFNSRGGANSKVQVVWNIHFCPAFTVAVAPTLTRK
ncbi:hypothetical protein LIPSTDRAFT_71137 [Lipomyces starkeyi NRRL Y-11557]|uniref:Uncharacterized protein n=1 Tax=Lipomyces starkeyi NRRL Y-11557 TaxID=675824 RepID=A0A1E3Q5V1_LIPST|nr:hypothetical protein LIPSTDRAFT_71137 [Lipomyces starkeyi NRRL Y-11557]